MNSLKRPGSWKNLCISLFYPSELSSKVMEEMFAKETEGLEQLLLEFPGLTSTFDPNKHILIQGNLQIEKQWYRIRVILPHFPKIDGFTLFVREKEDFVEFNSEKVSVPVDWGPADLINHTPNLMKDAKKSNNDDSEVSKKVIKLPKHLLHNIYAEVAALFNPLSYEIHINKIYTYIRVCKFTNFEQHYLEMRLPYLEIEKHSLPDGIPWTDLLRQKCSSLTAYVEQFQKYLQELQGFYEEFASIDELCYVVEPAKPTTKDNWRLFLLRKNVYLKLVITYPFCPVFSMKFQIIGPTYEVEKLRKMYSEGLTSWNFELDIHKNLLRIFDLCFFPMPLNEEQIENEEFCSICYSYKMNDHVPIISCDNQRCNLVYHAECLNAWFNTLTDGKQFLEVSLGTCPFCKENLSTSFEELLHI